MTAKYTAASERVGPIACRACDLNAICRLTALIASEARHPRGSRSAVRILQGGAALYRAGEPATALFAIRQGMIKLTRVTPEGEEHIVSFHTPGEVLGLEAFSMGIHSYDAIALGSAHCCELPLPSLADQTPQTAALATELVRLMSRLAVAQPAYIRGSVRERVTSFLRELSLRLVERGLNGTQLKLSMSRLEIANLLDTRIETISRTLRQLHRERAIHVCGDRVRVLNLGKD